MGHNLIALAVPFFFLFIGVELGIAHLQKRRVYRLADALADLGCGIGQRVTLVFFGAALMALYVWAYEQHRLFTVDGGRGWLFAVLAVDFVYYWWHRASHRVNAMWAAHVVHHQSEDYNLAVALRQAIFTPLTALPFDLPLAFLGVPPLTFIAVSSLNTLYQFWIHTELVGRLPRPIEWVMNTPSHHRVHHAINAQYLDKNYAGMFIVFDRLFGTFVEERERCVFGTTKRLQSFNSIWAQLAEYPVIAAKAAGASAWDKLRIWFMPPEWLPGGPAALPPLPAEKFESPAPARVQRYAVVQFAAVVVIAFLLMWFDDQPLRTVAIPGALSLLALGSIGALLDGRSWAAPLELVRLALWAAALAAWLWPLGAPLAVGASALLAAGSALWLRMASRTATALA